MQPTITAILRNKKPNKRGELPIMLRITYRRKTFEKSTGIMVMPSLFSSDKLIKVMTDNDRYKNRQIKKMIDEIEGELLKIADEHELTHDDIAAVLQGNKTKALTFLRLTEIVRGKYEGVYTTDYLRHWTSTANKVDAYHPNISVSAMTNTFLQEYEQYLRTVKKNGNNTVWSNMKDIHSILQKAKELKLINEFPYGDSFKRPAYKQSKRSYLLANEVAAIEHYADTGAVDYLRLVAAWFVLGCRCGMRDSDLARFNTNMIRDGKLYFTDEKTDTPQHVPIYPALQRAIDRCLSLRSKPENQVCNRFLKEIAVLCNIDMKLTMHVARHTFAVNYLNSGGRFEELRRLLGHNNIATTQIYGAITDSRIESEVMRVLGGE